MSPRRSGSTVAAVLTVASVALSACGSTDVPTPGGWREGERRGPWTLVYSGFGEAAGDGDTVRLAPTAAADHDITHGALAVDAAAPADVHLHGAVTTVEQRRDGTPNPWEVGWLLWRYTDPDHFYALALKPNGWELSKQDPAYPGKQRFMASGATPRFEVGSTHTADVVAVGDTMTVRVDGRHLATVTDTHDPYLTGGVALYTEDAVVDFTGVRTAPASALPSWATTPVPGDTGRGEATGSAPAPTTNRTTS